MSTVSDLITAWRAEGDRMERRGASQLATTLRSCAEELEQALGAAEEERLSLQEAAAACGLSRDHLYRLVRAGKIPTERAGGSRGRLRIRRGDLPARRPAPHTGRTDARDLASRFYGSTEAHHGHR